MEDIPMIVDGRSRLKRVSGAVRRAACLGLLFSMLSGPILYWPSQRAEAAASQFDMNFGTAGKVVTDFNGATDLGYDMAIQADGKIVVVGRDGFDSDFAVARYHVGGTLDNSFDGDGKVTTQFGGLDTAFAVAIQPDGKIVVAGDSRGPTGDHNFTLARYNSDGSLDTTFDGDGKVITVLAGFQQGYDIAIQPDGKIVVAGLSDNDFAVVRYNANGSPDTSFGLTGIGIVTTSILNVDAAYSLALQNDGKIIVAGYATNDANSDYALIRYNDTGTLDTTFDTDGIVTTSIGGPDIVYDVLLQPDGKIVAAGVSDVNFSLARFNPNGSLDTSFDSDGKVTADFGGDDYCNAIVQQSDGKIVAVGSSLSTGVAVARFNSNGSLDNSFHGDGKLNTSIAGNSNLAFAVAIQANGRIVVAGHSSNDFILTRFLGDPRAVVTNPNPIAPADRTANTNPPGLPSNYPSIADINGASGTVTKVRVILTNLNHTFPGDLDIVLVGPQGQQTILMSDAGGGNPGVTGRTYIFDQSAAANFPTTTAPSGFYKPFNGDGPANIEPGAIDVFPAPGPGSQNFGAANLDVFNGTNPNGIWKLYVVDDEVGDTGSLSTFTLEVTTTTSNLSNLISDFDGDGRADLSVRRPSDNIWYILRGFAGYFNIEFGVTGDLIAPADYDGDGKTDVCVFRPSNGTWYTFNSQSQSFTTTGWGADGDMPVPADHDGDGRADLVVFRPSTNTWYTRFANGTFSTTVFGVAGDKPLVGDFDGDGKADIGLYRPSDNNWYILKTGFGFFVQTWGVAGDIPVPADYDGDGKTDVAVFRPSTGQWFRIRSTAGFDTVNWGVNGDQPIPADYDGDGKSDVAVFRPSNATWYIVGSTSGQLIQNYGVAGDLPTQGAFIY
jgi:uncharacterized delta-60 repeat protein